MDQRGISTIIATVLTVLITVAAVTILWSATKPILDSVGFLDLPQVSFTIEKSGSYTIYDPENGYLSVQVKRGSDSEKIIALKFVFDIGGNSFSRKTYDVVGPNNILVYYFIFQKDIIINSVKIIPIYIRDGEEIEGTSFDIESKIPIKFGFLLEKVGEVPIVYDQEIVVTDGLVLYYTFESGYLDDGTISAYGAQNQHPIILDAKIVDQSGGGYFGKLNGQSAISTVLNGFEGRIYPLWINNLFWGSGDGFVFIENSDTLSEKIPDDMTISFWMNPTTHSNNCDPSSSIYLSNLSLYESDKVIFGSDTNYIGFVRPSCYNFMNDLGDKDKIVLQYNSSVDGIINTKKEITINSGWSYFTFVFSKSSEKVNVFINSEDTGIEFDIPNYQFNDNQFFLGVSSTDGSPNSNSVFFGNLDEFRIYNKALDIGEINTIYEFER